MPDATLKVDHPYYCAEGCYWAPRRDAHVEHESWADFLVGFGDADVDMNLVIRFDWKALDPDDYEGEIPERFIVVGQESELLDELTVHIVGQRKATLVSHSIPVSTSEMVGVRAYLRPHWRRLCDNWEPLSTDDAGVL